MEKNTLTEKILALDISTKTGFSVFENGKLTQKGLVKIDIKHLGINGNPDKHSEYPFNFVTESKKMLLLIQGLVSVHKPTSIVIENTVLSRNRHAQRLLEFMHYDVIQYLQETDIPFIYLSPGEWRSILGIKMTNDDKKNNKDVKEGKSKGKITKKHLSVRYANENFGLSLKMKDNDIADAIGLGAARYKQLTQKES